ncbi:MAG: hypothetical protein WC533_01800 [Candidatus Pacearchaeota archaeon]
MKKGVKIILIVLIIFIAISVYLTFIYKFRCDNIVCWEQKFERCSRASFVNDAGEVVWKYTILGKNRDGKCEVEVTAIRLKSGLKKSIEMEGQSMVCLTDLGTINNPETTPANCHGRLKETLQELMIEKLYQYILDNVGKVSQEIMDIESITSGNSTQIIVGNSTS